LHKPEDVDARGVNHDRASQGQAPSQDSPDLDKAAQHHSDWMAASTSNRGPNDDLGAPVDQM